jgi:hypothetical protein
VTPQQSLSLAQRFNLTEKFKEEESKSDVEKEKFLKEVDRYGEKYENLHL